MVTVLVSARHTFVGTPAPVCKTLPAASCRNPRGDAVAPMPRRV
jgi:hypothetical protein